MNCESIKLLFFKAFIEHLAHKLHTICIYPQKNKRLIYVRQAYGWADGI